MSGKFCSGGGVFIALVLLLGVVSMVLPNSCGDIAGIAGGGGGGDGVGSDGVGVVGSGVVVIGGGGDGCENACFAPSPLF